MERLDNARWGFASNCFVCEAGNHQGLRIPFWHDEERQVVVAEFRLDDAFSGAPRFVHGGVLLAVLDEAMAWATIAIAQRFAVTCDTTAHFEHAVRLDRPYDVEARVTAIDGDRIHTESAIRDERDRVCVSAHASFVPLDARQAARAIGETPTGDAADHVRVVGADTEGLRA
jgi:acyl-coenzyme A thioesterase PaaI-like protein